jgi:hypothetical protein
VSALILHDDSWLPRGGKPFTRPTEAQVVEIARALSDGVTIAATQSANIQYAALGWRWSASYLDYIREVENRSVEYTRLRDYLINEHDADPRIAAVVAMQFTKPLRRTPS